jgi:hypothetical protein
VIVDMRLAPVLVLLVLMGDVHVVDLGVVVLVLVGRREVCPVLALMHVVGDMEVFVTVHQLGVLMVTLRSLLHRSTSLGNPTQSERSNAIVAADG